MRTLLFFVFLGSAISGIAQAPLFHSFRTQGANINPAFNAHKEVADVTYLTKIGADRINYHLLQGSYIWKGLVLQSGVYRRYGAYYQDDRSLYLGASKSFYLGANSKIGLGANLRHNNPTENGRSHADVWCGTIDEPSTATVMDVGFTLKGKNMIWAVSINEVGFHTEYYKEYSKRLYPKSGSMSLFRTSHLPGIDLNYGVHLESGKSADFLIGALYKERLELGTGLRMVANKVTPVAPKVSLGYRFEKIRLIYTYLSGNSKTYPTGHNEHELGFTMSLHKKNGEATFNMF